MFTFAAPALQSAADAGALVNQPRARIPRRTTSTFETNPKGESLSDNAGYSRLSLELFEVVVLSREAATADSLGREPQGLLQKKVREP